MHYIACFIRRIEKIFTTILLFGVLSYSPLYGQWSPTNGPYGGFINCFGQDDTRLWVGTRSGPFYSDYSGISWQAAHLNASVNPDVYDFVLFGDTILCGTDRGIFRSTDRGQNWIQATMGLSLQPVVGAMVKKSELLFAGSHQGVFISTDKGLTWQLLQNTGLQSNAGIWSMTVMGNKIFVSIGSPGGPVQNGLFVSSDDGVHWEIPGTGLPAGNSFELAALNGNLYAATSGKGVFISGDSGTTWQPFSQGLYNFAAYAFAIADGFPIVSTNAGIFKYVNSGWTNIASNLQSRYGALTYFDHKIFVGSYGVFVIPEFWGGYSFEASNGILATSIYSLDAIPGGGLWADSGGYQSYDEGNHWQQGPLPFDLVVSNRTPHYVFGATRTNILRSADNGNSWIVLDSLNGHSVLKFVASDSLVVGCTVRDSLVFISHDAGLTWEQRLVAPGKAIDFRSAAVVGSNIYLGDYPGILWISRDAGLTWEGDINLQDGITALLSDSATVWAGTYGGLFVSHDAGLNWTPIQVGNGVTVTSLCKAGSYIFLSSWGYPVAPNFVEGGVWASSDDGATWMNMNDGFPPYTQLIVYALAADERYLYAAFYEEGVWRRPIEQLVSSHEATAGNSLQISIFPNPSTECSHLHFPDDVSGQGDAVLLLIDSNGKIVRREKVSGCAMEIQRAGLPCGLYFLQLVTGTAIKATGRIIFTD